MTIKAIETVYNGYRFRSRTEARWAVFFDALGIRYQYEPQGFDLGDGVFYLPDFYLPDFGYWIEIKNPAPEWGDPVWEKFDRFTEKAQKCLFISQGSPGAIIETHCGTHFICYSGFGWTEAEWGLNAPYSGDIDEENPVGKFGLWSRVETTPEVMAAIIKAKQARFEHGETPA